MPIRDVPPIRRPEPRPALLLRDFLALAAFLTFALSCGGPAADAPDSIDQARPTHPETPPFRDAPLVLVSLDTLRADHLSLYGYGRPTSPRLEELARQSVVFDRFYYSGGATLPSHMSLFTSLTPWTHGVELSKSENNVLPPARTTLAEVLRDAGYATAAFTDRGWMRARFGFDQGFDHFEDEGGHLERLLPLALQWTEEHAGEPFFLFLHTYDVHSKWKRLPYECPAPWGKSFLPPDEPILDGCRDGGERGELCASRLLLHLNRELRRGAIEPSEAFGDDELRQLRALYDGCIRYADEQIHHLFRRLEEIGVFDESVIVVLSDHGEEFLEHGRLIHNQHGYEEISRIPLLIRLPGGRLGGQRLDGLAAMVDVMPTLLDLLGLEAPADVQGRSLLPALTDGESVRDSAHMLANLVTEDWKLLADRKELYDLRRDPGEKRNVYGEHPQVVAELSARLAELRKRDRRDRQRFEVTAGAAADDATLSEEEKKELRALGYLE